MDLKIFDIKITNFNFNFKKIFRDVDIRIN